MLLNRANFAVKEAMSKDIHKYTLNSICVNNRETVATDTHIMAVVENPQVDTESYPKEFVSELPCDQVLIPANTIKKIEANIPNLKNSPNFNFTNVSVDDDLTVQFETTDLEVEQVVKTRQVAGTYPEYDKVMKAQQSDFESGYRLDLLEKMVKFFKATGIKKDSRIQFNFGSGANSMLIASATLKDTEQKCTAVVMPIRKQ